MAPSGRRLSGSRPVTTTIPLALGSGRGFGQRATDPAALAWSSAWHDAWPPRGGAGRRARRGGLGPHPSASGPGSGRRGEHQLAPDATTSRDWPSPACPAPDWQEACPVLGQQERPACAGVASGAGRLVCPAVIGPLTSGHAFSPSLVPQTAGGIASEWGTTSEWGLVAGSEGGSVVPVQKPYFLSSVLLFLFFPFDSNWPHSALAHPPPSHLLDH